MIITDTPVEVYKVDGVPVYVKREDKAASPPAPPFSKVRGLMQRVKILKAQGCSAIGYTETSISMAGWGVAWACKILGMKAVIFDPQYKKTPPLLKMHRAHWKAFKATLIPLPAGRAKVNFYASRKILFDRYGESAVVLPLGLPLADTVHETFLEGVRTRPQLGETGTLVVNVGSGTICSGVVQAFPHWRIFGVLGRSGDLQHKYVHIEKMSGVPVGGILNSQLELIDPGWEYTERSQEACPFPCHPWYDLKAWEWLTENIHKLNEQPPVLFWNIGQMGKRPPKDGMLVEMEEQL